MIFTIFNLFLSSLQSFYFNFERIFSEIEEKRPRKKQQKSVKKKEKFHTHTSLSNLEQQYQQQYKTKTVQSVENGAEGIRLKSFWKYFYFFLPSVHNGITALQQLQLPYFDLVEQIIICFGSWDMKHDCLVDFMLNASGDFRQKEKMGRTKYVYDCVSFALFLFLSVNTLLLTPNCLWIVDKLCRIVWECTVNIEWVYESMYSRLCLMSRKDFWVQSTKLSLRNRKCICLE